MTDKELIDKSYEALCELSSDHRLLEEGRRNDDCVDIALLSYIMANKDCAYSRESSIDKHDEKIIRNHFNDRIELFYEDAISDNTESYKTYRYFKDKINKIYPYLEKWYNNAEPLRYLTETWRTSIYRKED